MLTWTRFNLGAEKQFYLKAVCVDVSGNISEEVTRTYTIDDVAPEASDLTATVKEDQSAIELTWTSGQEEDLAGSICIEELPVRQRITASVYYRSRRKIRLSIHLKIRRYSL